MRYGQRRMVGRKTEEQLNRKKKKKKILKEKKLDAASLKELRYGHYRLPYFGFSLFSFLAIAILSIIYYWLGYGYHVMHLVLFIYLRIVWFGP